MANVLRSLDEMSTGYCVFEKDQVLTHTQLNELASYLDDQQRLTRVALFGVGVVCGLGVTEEKGRLVLGKGLGVTSDGDLIRVDADRSFDRFKAYDETAPIYPPFYDGEKIRPVFELLAEGTEESGTAVGDFEAKADRRLAEMVTVLFMESAVKDEDLCSGTDCDNKGQLSLNTVRLLLVDAKSASALQETLPTLDAAARRLPPVFADRPLLSNAIGSTAALTAVYRSACTSIRSRLAAALGQLFPAASTFLADLFPADPAKEWVARLNAIDASFAAPGAGLQYYYDFLKDVVETYNAFRDVLFGDAAVCCPDVGAFPKHLLLGVVGAATGTTTSRTGFYPSPAFALSLDHRGHARFLASKLHALINTFQLPSGSNLPIRITPSRFEDAPLEDRAIPFYYDVNTALPIHRAWSYPLQRRGMEQHNYSYNAARYDAQGAAASPLTAQIGAFSFFRIEGHAGQAVASAIAAIQREIAQKNLPFTVRAVMIGTDRTRVVKPPVRYSDLHRIHYLLRQDVSNQLDDMVQFSGAFENKVKTAVASGVINDASEETDGISVTQVAAQKRAAVSTNAAAAKTKLTKKYADYRADTSSWQTDIREAVTAGSEFKVNLGKVSKTEVVTPVDSMVANNHMLWVNWLDEIIKDKEEKEDDRLLLPSFLSQHPGAEHFAGVVRGGTFVLVHDVSGMVVGDLMLPYNWPEVVQEEPEERPLPRPGIKPPLVLDDPIRVLPSLDRFVKDKLTSFRTTDLEPAWKNEIALKGNYVSALRESVEVLGRATKLAGTTETIPPPRGVKVEDMLLDLRLRDTDTKIQIVDRLRERLLDPAVDVTQRTELEKQLKNAEQDLGRSIANTTQYVATANLDVREGSDGFVAMASVTNGLSKIADRGALTRVHRDLTSVSATAPASLQATIGNVVKTRFGNR